MGSKVSWIYEHRGALLTAITATATLWLASNGQLALYIHPRYNFFSIVACMLGLVLSIASMVSKTHRHAHHEHEPGSRRGGVPLRNAAASILLLTFAALGLLILQPKGLSSQLAASRGINSSTSTESLTKLSTASIISPFGGDTGPQLTIQEWAGLISQTPDSAFFEGKTATVEGFITRDERDPDSTFFASRYVLSCCAVDARPIGVAIKSPGWQATYQPDQWLKVQGAFSTDKHGRIVLMPANITEISQPEQPYVY